MRRLAPNPTRATLTLATPAVVPEAQTTPESQVTPESGSAAAPNGIPSGPAQVLSGAIELLGGTPLNGAPVLIQALTVTHKGEVVSERTIGETTTDAAGQWELDATPPGSPGGGIWLRALCPGGPGFGAGVSDSLHLPGNVSLTAPAASPPAG